MIFRYFWEAAADGGYGYDDDFGFFMRSLTCLPRHGKIYRGQTDGGAAVLYRCLNFLAAFANIWRAFHTLSSCCAKQGGRREEF